MLWLPCFGVLLLLEGIAFGFHIVGTDGPSQVELPDTTGISGQLTANLSVDRFFGLWIVFNDDVDVQISDKPFTILAPRNQDKLTTDSVLTKPSDVQQLLLDHMVLGQKLRLDDVAGAFHFRTLGGKVVSVQDFNGTLYANSAKVVEPRIDVAGGGVLVVLDDFLFPSDVISSPEPNTISSTAVLDDNSLSTTANTTADSTFFQNLVDLLSFFKNGVMVFQHFLARSNVSKLLNNDEEYTVLIPTDGAFQRWHPIDWGFYPFSVPEFTESVIINHFIPGNLRQEDIQDGQKAKTLGGREIVFTKNPFFMTANGAPIVQGDTPIHHGNLIFVSEVLFVTDAEVQALHQKHKDKETPPLLAFPWFGAQFLSHAFLALERQIRFTHITRFLNLADLAPYVSGKNYTFFVPDDTSFEALGLEKVADNYLSTGEGLNILVNHFVKGRLYQKDLLNGTKLTTLGNRTITITHKDGNLFANDAAVEKEEIFVYNLGTMFYINKVLFVTKDTLPASPPATTSPSPATIPPLEFTGVLPSHPTVPSIEPDVEILPEELEDDVGDFPDVLLMDDTTGNLDGTTSSVVETSEKTEPSQ